MWNDDAEQTSKLRTAKPIRRVREERKCTHSTSDSVVIQSAEGEFIFVLGKLGIVLDSKSARS